MKKNKIVKTLIIFSIFLIFSILMELLVFNFKNLILIDNKGIEDIGDKVIYNQTEEKNEVIIDLGENKYISKLDIGYTSMENVKIDIKFNYNNGYDESDFYEFKDSFNYKLNSTVINVNKSVNEVRISYPKEMDNLKIESIKIDNSIHMSNVRIIFIFSILTCGLILYSYFKNGAKTHNAYKIFFLIFVILGVNIIIIQPNTCYYSFDDQIHYENTNQLLSFRNEVSRSNSYAAQHFLFNDINSLEEVNQESDFLNNNKEVDKTGFKIDSDIYKKVGYVPSALGIFLGSLLHFPFTICFKLGKIFNLLSYALIMAYAIKKVKIGKRLLTVIALLPSSLFLATQYSYDPAVTAGLTLAFVLILNVFIDKTEKIDFKWMITFLLSILYASFVKAVYIPLILLILFIPKDRFENVKISRRVKIGICTIFLLVLATFVLPSVNGEAAGDVRGGNTSVSLQLSNIINHPFQYLNVLKSTMYEQFIEKFFGTTLIGGLGYVYEIGGNYYYLFLLLIFAVWITDYDSKKTLDLKIKILSIIDILSIILFIWTALYLSFTPVGHSSINGVQSRYFMPLLFPLLICLKPNKIKNNYEERKYNIFIFVFITCLLAIIIYNNFILSFGV